MVSLLDATQQALEQRAATADVTSQPQLYDILFDFYCMRSNFKAAATAQYTLACRLEDARARVPHWLHLRATALCKPICLALQKHCRDAKPHRALWHFSTSTADSPAVSCCATLADAVQCCSMQRHAVLHCTMPRCVATCYVCCALCKLTMLCSKINVSNFDTATVFLSIIQHEQLH